MGNRRLFLPKRGLSIAVIYVPRWNNYLCLYFHRKCTAPIPPPFFWRELSGFPPVILGPTLVFVASLWCSELWHLPKLYRLPFYSPSYRVPLPHSTANSQQAFQFHNLTHILHHIQKFPNLLYLGDSQVSLN